jgi:hypothetical protein
MSKFVMVDCISTYRMRYCVELNDDDPKEWAMDTVVMEEAKEFSQEHLGEMITSHRVLSDKEEAFEIFREDNEYLKDISEERFTEIGITLIEDYTK